MPNERLTQQNIIVLAVLLVFCIPAGILFLFWVISGKKGLLAGIGCFCVPFLLLAAWIVPVWYSNTHPEFGEHVNRVDWLPEEATDISFYKSYSYTAYEFKISEDGFSRSANALWNFVEITEPEDITRYNYFVESEQYYKQHPEFDYDAYNKLQNATTATVTHGIVAKQRWSNGGGYHAVYDRDRGIAYIQTNPR